jgi:hypothetical protein
VLAYLLLGVAQAAGLALIPFGAPGLWVQLAALALFGWWTDFAVFGPVPLGILLVVALAAELIEAPLARGRMGAGARRRLGFGGLAGGAAGAGAGVFFPLLGSMFGALLGALAGSLLSSFRLRPPGIGRGAFGGQVVAMATRTAAGIVIAAFALLVSIR